MSELRDDLPTIPPPQDEGSATASTPRPATDPTPSAIDRIYAAAESSHIREGELIGPYRVIELIGDGGFGAVYLAEQQEPVRRRVAVKVIKAGMASVEVLTRFEVERQALAMIDHPNVARVFDAGVSASGHPYFAMEYVPGLSITRHCAQAALSVRERLGLFLDICSAVQHAHQKGIIHRDLKPGNILITLIDGRPVPKVIDFGIAKATSDSLSDHPLLTTAGRLMGTPEYMSPEQAAGAGSGHADIDTRTDIHSLGVILYELLCGELPFDSARLRAAGFAGVIRILTEETPPRPSERLRRAVDVDARRLREVRGDLDWITMKAIDKDRGERYESAAALANDIRRHLANEPVQAGPPSATYRFSKFARRNRTALIAGTAIGIAMLTGLVFSIRFSLEANRDRRLMRSSVDEANQARESALRERQRALDSQKEAVRQKELAEAAEKLSEEQREAVILAKREVEEAKNALLFSAAQDAFDRGEVREARAKLLACDPSTRHWEWYAMAGWLDAASRTLHRPSETPVAARFSPDGANVYVAGLRITRYDAATLLPANSFGLGKASNARGVFRSIAVSPDGATIAAVRLQGDAIELFRSDTGDGLRKIPILRDLPAPKAADTPSWRLGEVRFTPDGRQVAVSGWVVRTFDVSTGAPLKHFPHDAFAQGLAVTPDGRLLVTASNDAKLRLFELHGSSEAPIRTVELIDAAASIDATPDGRDIAVGFQGSPIIQVFDAATLTAKASFVAGGSDTSLVRFNGDGSLIAACSSRGTLTVWSARTGVRLRTWAAQANVSDLAWSPSGTSLATAGAPASVKFWELGSLPSSPLSRASSSRLGYVSASADTSMLIGLDASAAPGIWRFDATGRAERRVAGENTSRLWFAAINATGSTAMATGRDGTMKVYDLGDGTLLHAFPTSNKRWAAGAVSPDATSMAAITLDGRLEFFSLPSGELRGFARVESSMAGPGSYSSDGRLVGFAGSQGLWLATTPPNTNHAAGEFVATLLAARTSTGRGAGVRFSHDGRRVIGVWDNGTHRCWDLPSEKLLWEQPGDLPEGGSYGLSFNRDGSRVLLVGHSQQAGMVRLLNASTGQTVLQWAHDASDPVLAGAFISEPNGDERMVLTRASLLRETISTELGRVFERTRALIGPATDLFTDRMRTWSDQATNSGLLTLFSDIEPIDKKEKVFDQIMADATVDPLLKRALIESFLNESE